MFGRGNAPAARYELVTRTGCHLCHEMAALLDAVLPAYGLTWQPVDVDGNPTLRLRYGEAVPVLLRDGKPVAKIRVDRVGLERIVRRQR